MSNLVRVFTCSSVLALGGATAASSMLACGGDDAPADDGASSSSSSSSGKSSTSSSSSSSSSSGSTAKCEPSGTYEFPGAVYTGVDGACVEIAKKLNGLAGHTYTYAKAADGSYTETEDGATNVMKIDPDSGGLCALTGGQGVTGLGAKDLDGKDATVDLSGQVKVFFNEAEARYAGVFDVTSTTAGAKGFPCTITFKTDGTKK